MQIEYGLRITFDSMDNSQTNKIYCIVTNKQKYEQKLIK